MILAGMFSSYEKKEAQNPFLLQHNANKLAPLLRDRYTEILSGFEHLRELLRKKDALEEKLVKEITCCEDKCAECNGRLTAILKTLRTNTHKLCSNPVCQVYLKLHAESC